MPDVLSGMYPFLFGIGLLGAGGLLSLFLPERRRILIPAIVAGVALPLVLTSALPVLFGAIPPGISITLGYPLGVVRFALDPLSAFFAALIAVASFPGTLYAAGYLRPYLGTGKFTGAHTFFLCLFIAFMLLTAAAQNAVAFLVCWEIMSLSSFFLVVFEHEKEDVLQAGIYYLIATHIGVAFLIAGFILLGIRAGSPDFEAFRTVTPILGRPAVVIFFLLFAGFGIKAGFIPFHTWLPKAHPAAPSHVSGLMSGVMIKLGIYGILRTLTFIGTPSPGIAWFVLGISVITAAFGVMYAIAQHDLKRLLAYHSVENIGIIGMGIGVGMLGTASGHPVMAALGFAGGILHVLNHSLFKGLLFYGAGAVYLGTHTRDIERLGGLVHTMPYTAGLFLTGSLAISGLPPLNGFVSEFIIYSGMLAGVRAGEGTLAAVSAISVFALAFIGAMAFLCFTKAFGVVFLGHPRNASAEKPAETDGVMLAAMGILALLCALIGFLPQYAVRVVAAPVCQIAGLGAASFSTAVMPGFLDMVSLVCILFMGLLLAVILFRHVLLRGKTVARFKTWDCGYQAGNARMQYTASSYAGPFVGLVSRPLDIRHEIVPPDGLFPEHARFSSESHDLAEYRGIRPITGGLRRFLDLFSWIQSGNTQQYVLYGLIFLVMALCWVMGVSR